MFGLQGHLQQAQPVSIWDSVLFASEWNGHLSIHKFYGQADGYQSIQYAPKQLF